MQSLSIRRHRFIQTPFVNRSRGTDCAVPVTTSAIILHFTTRADAWIVFMKKK
jgi:hypothetical protein